MILTLKYHTFNTNSILYVGSLVDGAYKVHVSDTIHFYISDEELPRTTLIKMWKDSVVKQAEIEKRLNRLEFGKNNSTTKEVEIGHSGVENYNVTEYENGLIMITINTVDKWVQYSTRQNDTLGIIEGEIKIPERDRPGYMTFTSQEKDQIYLLMVPKTMLT